MYRPHTFSNGKAVNGVTQNHVKAMIIAACFELSRPSIGHEMVLQEREDSVSRPVNSDDDDETEYNLYRSNAMAALVIACPMPETDPNTE